MSLNINFVHTQAQLNDHSNNLNSNNGQYYKSRGIPVPQKK